MGKLDYAESLSPTSAPSPAELRQISAFFDIQGVDGEIKIFSHKCYHQTDSNCLYLAFLNVYLLLCGYELSDWNVNESFIRVWILRCFCLNKIVCPFRFGIIPMER